MVDRVLDTPYREVSFESLKEGVHRQSGDSKINPKVSRSSKCQGQGRQKVKNSFSNHIRNQSVITFLGEKGDLKCNSWKAT